jgi:glycosyltransferase involved in cell wall biosynthesis
LITGLGRGGAETQLVALARHLKSCGWDPEVVSLLPPARHPADTRQFLAELRDAEIRVWSPGIARRRAALRGLWALARRWRVRRPDLLCTFMFHANVVGRILGRLARVPVVVSSIRNERFGPRWRERLEAVTERFCDVTVVNSGGVADSLATRGVLHPGRCRVIPNGVDLVRFAPRTRAARESTRRRLGVPRHAFLFLTVGRLYPHKDHTSLLRALSLVRRRHPEARLAVAGDGPLLPSLRTEAAALGLTQLVDWLGLRDDVPDLLAASDAFVLSSRWEGSPNVVLESLAAAVPVASSAVGGVHELVEDGRSGFLVPPGDVTALAAAMEQLLSLSPGARRRMGARGRESVMRHDTRAVLEQWHQLLSEAWTTRAASLRRAGRV